MTREELKALIENGLITGAYSPTHTELILAEFDRLIGVNEKLKRTVQHLQISNNEREERACKAESFALL